MKKPLIPILLLAGLSPALNGCGGKAETAPSPQSDVAETATTVRTLEVRAAEVVDTAVMSADLLPLRQATLAAEVSGAVEHLAVDIGDRVARGSVLARIDTRALKQQVSEAEALFRQARDQFERTQKLFEKRSITQGQLVDAEAAHDVAAARLASARLQLEKSQVKAPWSGAVSARHVEVGDYASPGQPLVDLVAVNRLKVRAAASAADVPFLAPGTPVRVQVDAFPGEVFTGEVVRLGAALDRDTRTLELEAEIDNPDGRLRPGFFGRLTLPRRVIPDAILVPLSSVIDFEDHQVVYVVNGDRAELRRVSLGPVIGDTVVVTDGVESGERVIVAGLQQIADGEKVTEEGAG